MNKITAFKKIGIRLPPKFWGHLKADLYSRPEDFIVEEIFPQEICSVRTNKVKKGVMPQITSLKKPYLHATLIKKNLSTINACLMLSQKNNIPIKNITYCGFKDTLGWTAQKICLQTNKRIRLQKNKQYVLTNFCSCHKKLKARDHQGNHFEVKIRNIHQMAQLEKFLTQHIHHKIIALPNFYGPQRFGPRLYNHQWGKKILKKQYKSFINHFLTDVGPFEASSIIKCRKKIKKILGQWPRCLKVAQQNRALRDEQQLLKNIIKYQDYLLAIKNLEIASIFVHAVSSYLFNLALSKQLSQNKKYINNSLEKIGANTKLNQFNRLLYASILKQERMSLSSFKTHVKQFYIDGHRRFMAFSPQNMIWERLNNKTGVLKFDLGVGEYASLVLEFIFDNRRGIKLN